MFFLTNSCFDKTISDQTCYQATSITAPLKPDLIVRSAGSWAHRQGWAQQDHRESRIPGAPALLHPLQESVASNSFLLTKCCLYETVSVLYCCDFKLSYRPGL